MTVCSREVAAFSSPPSPSKISAICCAVYDRLPLKSRCSMKCVTPDFVSGSSREPAPIQKPRATERTLLTRSVISRSPESSSERTYSCTREMLVAAGRRTGEDALVADVHNRLRRHVGEHERGKRYGPVGRLARGSGNRLEVAQELRIPLVARSRLRSLDRSRMRRPECLDGGDELAEVAVVRVERLA